MRFRMVWFGLLLCLVLHSARQQEDEQEQEPRVRQQTRPLTLLSFVNPPAASCNPSEWGQFFMVPSRDLDPVVMLQRPERSASAGGKLCLREPSKGAPRAPTGAKVCTWFRCHARRMNTAA